MIPTLLMSDWWKHHPGPGFTSSIVRSTGADLSGPIIWTRVERLGKEAQLIIKKESVIFRLQSVRQDLSAFELICIYLYSEFPWANACDLGASTEWECWLLVRELLRGREATRVGGKHKPRGEVVRWSQGAPATPPPGWCLLCVTGNTRGLGSSLMRLVLCVKPPSLQTGDRAKPQEGGPQPRAQKRPCIFCPLQRRDRGTRQGPEFTAGSCVRVLCACGVVCEAQPPWRVTTDLLRAPSV